MTEPITRERIEHLRNMLTKQVSGEWYPCASGDGYKITEGENDLLVAGNYDYEEGGICDGDDADLICDAINSLPAILNELEQLRDNEAFLESSADMADLHAEKWQKRALEAESTIARVRKLADNDDLDWWVQGMILAAMAGES